MVSAICAMAEEDYKYGGDEDEHGGLNPGHVNFESLQAKILSLIDQTDFNTNNTNQNKS